MNKIQSVAVSVFAFTFVAAAAFAAEKDEPSFSGVAHWYGKELHGNRTASGVVFDKDKLTAAHPTLKFGTRVKVVSRATGKEVVVEINDRCPALKARVIDLSEAAAKEIGIWPHARKDVDCYVLSSSPKK